MAYTPSTPELGIQPIAQSSTVQNHPIGTIVKAYDPTLGEGEFIYLPGVASNAVGALVTWNAVAGTTTLVPSTAKLGYPVGVSMNANTSTTSYSWYQIGGAAKISKGAVAISSGSRLWASATGVVNGTSVAGKGVWNAYAVNSTVSANTYTTASINRPFMEPIAT